MKVVLAQFIELKRIASKTWHIIEQPLCIFICFSFICLMISSKVTSLFELPVKRQIGDTSMLWRRKKY